MTPELLRYFALNLLILLIWMSIYRLWLAKLTLHGWNRFYLLMGLVVSVLVPLLPLTSAGGDAEATILPTIVISGVTEQIPEEGLKYWPLIYTVVALGLIIRLTIAIVAVFKKQAGESSFSFFRKVSVQDDLEEKHRDMVMEHEHAHRKLGHSLDLVLLEVYKIVHWMNPAIYMLSRDIRKIHEYQADEYALRNNTPKHEYAELLVMNYLGLQPPFITNSFNHKSILKQRIKMLSQEKSPRSKRLLFLSLLPLVAGAILIASCTKSVEESTSNPTESVFKQVDVQPEFPGGKEALFNWMMENLEYPEELKESGIEGKVMVSFVVSTSGKVEQVQVLKGVHEVLDAASVKAVQGMPDWKPGEKDGKVVNTEMVIPLSYRLD